MFIEWMHDLWLRLKTVFKRRQLDRDLGEELEFHLAMKEQKLIEQGMPPREAHYAARRSLGNVTSLKETSREMWIFPWLETFVQDIRYGLLQLRRSPGFTVVAIFTLALGIGGTTAIFSVIYCGVFDPLPYRDSHRLALLVARNAKTDQAANWAWVSPPEFQDYKEKSQAFDDVLGMASGLAAENIVVVGTDTPEIPSTVYVTENTFRVLGVPPLLGRPITPADCRPDAPLVAVIGFNYWRSRFGGDPDVIGRAFLLSHRSAMVVGVMPPRFTWGGGEMWLPVTSSKGQLAGGRTPFSVVGHLKSGVTMWQADAEVAVLSKAFAAVYPNDHPKDVSLGVESLVKSATNEWARRTLYMLWGAVGLLLAIACVNVANLLLARIASRKRETAIRASLGAGRLRIVRQFMTESLLIALARGGLGCLLARAVLDTLVASLPPWTLPSEAEVSINGPVLLSALAIALLSPMLFGLAPSLFAFRKDVQELLNATGTRSSEGRGHSRLRNLLVVSQVTLSLVLLAGAGLLIRSFFALRHVDLGYNTHQVLSVALGLPEARYKTSEQKHRYFMEALRRARAVPGVVSAAICTGPPMWGAAVAKVDIPGRTGDGNWNAHLHLLSDHFYETMGIPLHEGRDISEQDVVHIHKVAVVNRAFVSKYFGGEDPLGREIKITNGIRLESTLPISFEVIGVAADIRDNGPSAPVEPQVYVPFTSSGFAYQWILARTARDPAVMRNPVLRIIGDIDKDLTVGSGGGLSNGPMAELFNSQFTLPRFVLTMITTFAALGLVLVSFGVYGVLSYAVSRRTQEIGIRMALGAEAGDVRWWVVKAGMRWLVVGIGIGVPASIALAKVLQNRIWGIKSPDPLTLLAVSLVLATVGFAACYFPARRATKVDPLVALRYE
jgi:putative ABC transport system permease protein